MSGNYFDILQLSPGRYSPQRIDGQYRSVRKGIMRSDVQDRQRRLDDVLIARTVLRNPRRQRAILDRLTQATAQAAPVGRPAAPVHRRPIAAGPAPAVPATPRLVAPPSGADAHDRFTRMVADHVESGLLRYTARRRLLLLARGLGIGEFKANLIIAETLHDLSAGGRPGGAVSRAGAGQPGRTSAEPAWGWRVAMIGGFAVIQAIFFAWWLG